jgi:osmoprotectant transport system ATP-binding protein
MSEIGQNRSAVVECQGVCYLGEDGRALVSELSFEVAKGETLVLLGQSGSGKTTTLKLINRLLDPTRGQVIVEGRRTTDHNPVLLRRRMGYVIQEIGLMPHMTVERNVALVPVLEGWDQDRIRARVEELLHLVGLDPGKFRSRKPHQLSGGQRQRVGVARALAADPPILLMDEPFGALDPITRAEIQHEFLTLKRRLNKTIVFVTHDLREALLMGDRIGLMTDGRLVALQPASGFLTVEKPEVRAYVAAFRGQDPRFDI